MADEYIGRGCSSIKITDPFNGNHVELGERAKTAIDVADGSYPTVFKSAKDAKIRDYETFLLKAEGDYNEEEDNAVRTYYKKS